MSHESESSCLFAKVAPRVLDEEEAAHFGMGGRNGQQGFRIAGIALATIIGGGLLTGCQSLSQNSPICAVSPPCGERDCSSDLGWWSLFHDSELDQLMGLLEKDNLQLRSLTADWNADHLGRFRQSIGGRKADIDLAEKVNELNLSLHSQLAQSYFSLRFLDEEQRILEVALETRNANVALAKKRFEGGRSSEFDVAQAETDLASTRADLSRLTVPRTKLENAIGSLVGVDPSCFRIETAPLKVGLPVVKAGVPVSVLGNRPGVSAAIARLKIANSRVGLEKCQFFPPNDLIGNGELCRVSCSNFMEWSCRTFTCCPLCEKPGGAEAAQVKALVDYQKAMLDALRETDDALADLAALCSEREAQMLAVRAAKQTAGLSRKRYDEGDIGSTELSNAERGQLAAERRLVQIRSQQYAATVTLMKALGGRGVAVYFSKS